MYKTYRLDGERNNSIYKLNLLKLKTMQTMNNLTQDLTKYVNLMEDSGFKAVYGDVQNKPLLIHLLNLVLPEGVVVKDIVKYRDRERSASTIYGKSVRLDLLCEGEDGSLFDVEVQRDRQDYFFERCLYYAS